MEDRTWLAQRFEEHRGHLRGVAYRVLGSLSDAEDAVQETWRRLNRSDAGDIQNLSGWQTTIVARVCLDMLRSRKARGEESLEERVADPVANKADASDPEQEALLADSVGIALRGKLSRVLSFTIANGKIVQADIIADPARLRELDLSIL